MRLAVWLCAASTSVALAESKALEEPQAQWAVSFLLNAAIGSEFLAASEAASADPALKSKFQSDPEAAIMAARALFALRTAQGKSQELGFTEALEKALEARGLGPKTPTPTVEAVGRTYQGTPYAAAWETLAATFQGASPSCPLEASEVVAFASFQKGVVEKGRTPNGAELLARLDGWSDFKVRCLVFALMGASEGAKRETGFEPLPLMLALRQRGDAAVDATALKALMAVRLMQVGDYAESLRLLVELADAEPAFRLPYQTVQRVFGLRQRGQGNVALRGM